MEGVSEGGRERETYAHGNKILYDNLYRSKVSTRVLIAHTNTPDRINAHRVCVCLCVCV